MTVEELIKYLQLLDKKQPIYIMDKSRNFINIEKISLKIENDDTYAIIETSW